MSKKVKEVSALIKLQILAGKATPAPPIGPALGQHGVSIVDFCKAYNDETRDKGDMVIPVEITVYKDRTFTFVLKTPPTSDLILKTLGIKKGSSNPNTKFVGVLTPDQVNEIVKIKMPDLNANSFDSGEKIIAGTARSMGVKIKKKG